MAAVFFQLGSSSCSPFAFNPATNPTEFTSKISLSYPYLVQDTTFFPLDSSISFYTDLTALILAPVVLILNTATKTIHLKRKLDHAALLHLTQKKMQS